MKLTPLPVRPPNTQLYDRTIPSGEESFTPVWRLGSNLLISTVVNRASLGLFLLDTGANFSQVDATFARFSTKLYANQRMHVRGISGAVNEFFEADKAELAFARFRQPNLGLAAFNINNSPRHQELRLSGILGLPILSMFRLDLDYRNGLVNFDFVLK